MKRLLCIITALDAGGAETFLMKIYRGLTEEYRLDFVVFRPNGVYEKEVRSFGGKIYCIPNHSTHPLMSLFSIYSIVKENKYRYVLKLSDTPIGVFDVLAAKLGGASHISVRSCNAASDMGVIKNFVCRLLRPLFNHFADKKVAPSELAGRFTFGNNEYNKGNVELLHNGVDLHLFSFSCDKRRTIRSQFNLQNRYVVGNVGRFMSQKNHHFLLVVFKCVLQIRPDAILMMVGNGEKEEEIKQAVTEMEIADKVIFAGLQKDVTAFYSAMDVYVHTAFYEGMPNAVIEAQASGLPCIISDTITREANITGLVDYLPLGNPELWARKILSKSETSRIDQQASFLNKGYDIESVRNRFITLFFEGK